MTFDGESLSSSTRTGAGLEYDRKALVVAEQAKSFPLPEGLSGKEFKQYILYNRSTGQSFAYSTLNHARARLVELSAGESSLVWRIGRVTPDAVILTDDVDAGFTWEALAKSTVFGWIQGRLYSGS